MMLNVFEQLLNILQNVLKYKIQREQARNGILHILISRTKTP